MVGLAATWNPEWPSDGLFLVQSPPHPEPHFVKPPQVPPGRGKSLVRGFLKPFVSFLVVSPYKMSPSMID